VRRAGGAIELLRTNAPLLGAFEGMSYTEDDVVLGRGDLLLLYTDGVVECRGEAGQYGEDRLCALLEGDALVAGTVPEAVRADLEAWSGGVLADDIAVVAIELAAASPLRAAGGRGAVHVTVQVAVPDAALPEVVGAAELGDLGGEAEQR
jgi:hypothetical protein